MLDGRTALSYRNGISLMTAERWREANFKRRYARTVGRGFFMAETCIICYSEAPEALFVRCGHICMCFECYESFQSDQGGRHKGQCPVCRSVVRQALHVK